MQHLKKHTDMSEQARLTAHVSFSVCTKWVRETGVARKPQFRCVE